MHGAFLSGLREAANITHHANIRSSKLKIEKNPSLNTHSCASILADLFREPDLEFGSFAVIFGTENSDPKSTAVLRVTFSGTRKKNYEGIIKHDPHRTNKIFQQLQSHFNQKQELHVYTLLNRQQVLELREVRGGDEMRLNYLCEKLGVKLVGRKGLGPSADSIVASIKADRANRKPASSSTTLKSGATKVKAATLKQKLVRKAKILGKRTIPNQNVNVGSSNNGSSNPDSGNGSSLQSLSVAPCLDAYESSMLEFVNLHRHKSGDDTSLRNSSSVVIENPMKR